MNTKMHTCEHLPHIHVYGESTVTDDDTHGMCVQWVDNTNPRRGFRFSSIGPDSAERHLVLQHPAVAVIVKMNELRSKGYKTNKQERRAQSHIFDNRKLFHVTPSFND